MELKLQQWEKYYWEESTQKSTISFFSPFFLAYSASIIWDVGQLTSLSPTAICSSTKYCVIIGVEMKLII